GLRVFEAGCRGLNLIALASNSFESRVNGQSSGNHLGFFRFSHYGQLERPTPRPCLSVIIRGSLRPIFLARPRFSNSSTTVGQIAEQCRGIDEIRRRPSFGKAAENGLDFRMRFPHPTLPL